MKSARFSNGEAFPAPISKVVCVGRNYAEHARELNNPVPATPILFIKPNSAVVDLEGEFTLGGHGDSVHYEGELAILIGKTLTDASAEMAQDAIAGLGLALDLTLRSVQTVLKEKGLPWEIAKAFDGACPLSVFAPLENQDLAALEFWLEIDSVPKQHGQSAAMLTSITRLLAYMSTYFTLLPGDVVLTGTPAGVGELRAGNKLNFFSNFGIALSASVK
jgi:2-keto-4-pentenoate hydratase/2-oxohepta-3-ene-1,7-dioic acid hydratase in catechol pathway